MFERFFLAIIFTLSLYLLLQSNQSSPKPHLIGEKIPTPSSMMIVKSILHQKINHVAN